MLIATAADNLNYINCLTIKRHTKRKNYIKYLLAIFIYVTIYEK